MGSVVHFVKESTATVQQVTETNPLPVSQTSVKQTVRIDDAGTNQYFGFAPIGSANGDAVWQISRLSAANPQELLFADGNSNYDNVWDNRASLSYS